MKHALVLLMGFSFVSFAAEKAVPVAACSYDSTIPDPGEPSKTMTTKVTIQVERVKAALQMKVTISLQGESLTMPIYPTTYKKLNAGKDSAAAKVAQSILNKDLAFSTADHYTPAMTQGMTGPQLLVFHEAKTEKVILSLARDQDGTHRCK